MTHFSERVYQTGSVRIGLVTGDPLRFDYEAFAWCANGIQFKISSDNYVFVPYNAIVYAQFRNEVKDNAQT